MERMEHIHAPRKTYRVNGAVGVPVMVLPDFQDAGPAEAGKWPRGKRSEAALCLLKCVAHFFPNGLREVFQVFAGRPTQTTGFIPGCCLMSCLP